MKKDHTMSTAPAVAQDASQFKNGNGGGRPQSDDDRLREQADANLLKMQQRRSCEFQSLETGDKVELSLALVKSVVSVPTKSGKYPDDRECFKFMKLCEARKLNPLVGDAYLIGYDQRIAGGGFTPVFNIVVAHSALLKRAEINPHYKGMKSGVIIVMKVDGRIDGVEHKEGDIVEMQGDFFLPDRHELVGGWARITRNDRDIEVYDRLNLSVFDTGYSRWAADPGGMIVKCFDDQTEVLTDRGFVLFSEVSDQRILQVTECGLAATDAVPFVQDYVGDMIVNENQNLDFSVTPNHDMVLVERQVGEKIRIEASEMIDRSRRRPVFDVPRTIKNNQEGLLIDDDSLRLLAIFLCCGYAHDKWTWAIKVSRQYKIDRINEINRFTSTHTRRCAGDESAIDGRTVTTRHDQEVFYHRFEFDGLVSGNKVIDFESMLRLNRDQCRVIVDTMVEFDGHVKENGCRRFYQNDTDVKRLFEILAVNAGYSVSSNERGGGRFCLAISSRASIPVRNMSGDSEPSLRRQSYSGEVWCVTVPSGEIIVRRHGFSFVCGNCTEASVLRTAFPGETSGMYVAEEFDSAQRIEAPTREFDIQDIDDSEDRLQKKAAQPKAKKTTSKKSRAKTPKKPADLKTGTQVEAEKEKAPPEKAPEQPPEAVQPESDTVDVEQGETGTDGEPEASDGQQQELLPAEAEQEQAPATSGDFESDFAEFSSQIEAQKQIRKVRVARDEFKSSHQLTEEQIAQVDAASSERESAIRASLS